MISKLGASLLGKMQYRICCNGGSWESCYAVCMHSFFVLNYTIISSYSILLLKYSIVKCSAIGHA